MKINLPQNFVIPPRHQKMVFDERRTLPLEQAILKLVKKGDVVFDLGCGSGILTYYALKAGAKKVYACDLDDTIKTAQKNLAAQNLSERVVFFNALSNEISIPEKADIIIAETVGSLGFNENILPFIEDARKRLLKKGGLVIPQSIEVWAAATSLPHQTKKSKGKIEEIDFTTTVISKDNIISDSQLVFKADLKSTKFFGFDEEIVVTAKKKADFTGFACWVVVEWMKGLKTVAAPDAPTTHWEQVFLPATQCFGVDKGDRLNLRLRQFPKDEIYSDESWVEWGTQLL